MILSELASRLGCELRGRGDVEVARVAGLEHAGPGDLSFVASPRYLSLLAKTGASAVIVAPDVQTPLPALVSPNPYLTYARAATALHPPEAHAPGVHPSAQVHETARLGDAVSVGPLAVIGPRVEVGERCVIHPHVVLYPDVKLGADCRLHSGVHVRERCRLGARVVVHNGSVIGGDGFGFARDEDGRYEKIPQIGVVVVEDDVEIGSLVAIDRAAMHETRIKRGAKLDNLVQIGHSVVVGEHAVLAGQVGVAGSSRIGDRAVLAGQVGVAGHLTLGDGVVATAQTGIPGSVEAGTMVSGTPAIENRRWLRASAVFARLPDLQKRVRDLERQLEELRKKVGDGS